MINGFSKLNENQKIQLLSNLSDSEKEILKTSFNLSLSKLTENVVGSYSLPLSIVPNCAINGKEYFIPMVTEESSIVAACANAFKLISLHGGFESRVLSAIKKGTVYFDYSPELMSQIESLDILNNPAIQSLNENMKTRNAGIIDLKLHHLGSYLKLVFTFNTSEAMGANFINTILEQASSIIQNSCNTNAIMSILSNNYDQCLTESKFKIPLDKLSHTNLSPSTFIEKFSKAMDIANLDLDRTVTHNKGFMNGLDAVLLATGQDYRAINAAIHSYASKSGQYQSLSSYEINATHLIFKTTLPLSVGVVGGVTKAHPMVKINQKIISNELSVEVLSQIIASAGLAQNFAAISALIGEGIQKGHMKMHLDNILLQLNATENECDIIKNSFLNKNVSFKDVEMELKQLRG